MKNLILPYLLMTSLFFMNCSSDDNNTINNQDSLSDNTTYDITPILSKFDNIEGLSYAITGAIVQFITDGLPNHKSPYWGVGHPMYEAYNGTNSAFNLNPNEISSQNIVFSIPLKPQEATNKEATRLGPIGVSVNGVVLFNQYAGPNNQPLTNEINSFDQYQGHPTGTDQYHYHVEPLYLTSTLGKSSFLGLLADGFPVYGPEENGNIITSASLDEYHGHNHANADFPEGIYHYHITMDDPYINGNGYFGTPGNISQ